MFEVRVKFPFDHDFEENDDRLKLVAGPSNYGGAYVGSAGCGMRDKGYVRETTEEAQDLQERIHEAFPDWLVSMREQPVYS